MNRANARVHLDIADVERALGVAAEFRIPSDIAIPQAVNRGVPVVLDKPRAPAALAWPRDRYSPAAPARPTDAGLTATSRLAPRAIGGRDHVSAVRWQDRQRQPGVKRRHSSKSCACASRDRVVRRRRGSRAAGQAGGNTGGRARHQTHRHTGRPDRPPTRASRVRTAKTERGQEHECTAPPTSQDRARGGTSTMVARASPAGSTRCSGLHIGVQGDTNHHQPAAVPPAGGPTDPATDGRPPRSPGQRCTTRTPRAAATSARRGGRRREARRKIQRPREPTGVGAGAEATPGKHHDGSLPPSTRTARDACPASRP